MSDVAETIEYKGHTIEICSDENPESPREWDNLTEIHYHSSSYVLGDTNWRDNMDGYEKMLKEAKRQGDLIIPMFAYIHSGICLSLAHFYGRVPQGHAQFDSGRAGTVIIRRKKMIEEFGSKVFTKKLKEKAYKIAEGEIATLNQYYVGDVYGYNIDDGDGDSCYGYYGMDCCIEEAKSIVDWQVKEDIKKHCEKVKHWIKNRVKLIYRESECFG